MDVAAAKVHAVGERVGELGGDRPDLAPDPPEVVQQPRPLGRKLLEQAREPEDVHGASVRLPLSDSQGDPRVVGQGRTCRRRALLGSRPRATRSRSGARPRRRASGRSSAPAARRSAPACGRRRPERRPVVPPGSARRFTGKALVRADASRSMSWQPSTCGAASPSIRHPPLPSASSRTSRVPRSDSSTT